jgi:hypothetical protein
MLMGTIVPNLKFVPGGTEEYYENPQSGQPESWMIFEPGTSGVEVRIVTPWAGSSGFVAQVAAA